MTTYVWQGTSITGKKLAGEVKAESRNEVLKSLRRQRIRITLIREKQEITGLFNRKKKVRVKDLGLFTRQFSTMISAGLPMIQCSRRRARL